MRSKDKELMDKLKSYIDEYAIENGGNTPSTRELGRVFGVTNVTIFRYLKAMHEMGIINYTNGTISSDRIKIIDTPQTFSPVFYNEADHSLNTDEDIVEYIKLPTVFTDGSDGPFIIVKAMDNSMKDAGIADGECVVFKKQNEAREGDIVLARDSDGLLVIRKLHYNDNGGYLLTENNRLEEKYPVIKNDFELMGVAIKVAKNIG